MVVHSSYLLTSWGLDHLKVRSITLAPQNIYFSSQSDLIIRLKLFQDIFTSFLFFCLALSWTFPLFGAVTGKRGLPIYNFARRSSLFCKLSLGSFLPVLILLPHSSFRQIYWILNIFRRKSNGVFIMANNPERILYHGHGIVPASRATTNIVTSLVCLQSSEAEVGGVTPSNQRAKRKDIFDRYADWVMFERCRSIRTRPVQCLFLVPIEDGMCEQTTVV